MSSLITAMSISLSFLEKVSSHVLENNSSEPDRKNKENWISDLLCLFERRRSQVMFLHEGIEIAPVFSGQFRRLAHIAL